VWLRNIDVVVGEHLLPNSLGRTLENCYHMSLVTKYFMCKLRKMCQKGINNLTPFILCVSYFIGEDAFDRDE
jgi:hypothetical protein